jgi:hypothetical protein
MYIINITEYSFANVELCMSTIETIDNEMINLIKLHYLLFELHSTRPKFDI